jgi:hypothetical protein
MANSSAKIIEHIGALKDEIIAYLNQGDGANAKKATDNVQVIKDAAANIDNVTAIITTYNQVAEQLNKIKVVQLEDLFSAQGQVKTILDTLYEAATMPVDQSVLDYFTKKQELPLWETYQKQMFDNGKDRLDQPITEIVNGVPKVKGNWRIVTVKGIRPKLGETEWTDVINNISNAITEMGHVGATISDYIKIFAVTGDKNMTSKQRIDDWAKSVREVSDAINKQLLGESGALTEMLKTMSEMRDKVQLDPALSQFFGGTTYEQRSVEIPNPDGTVRTEQQTYPTGSAWADGIGGIEAAISSLSVLTLPFTTLSAAGAVLSGAAVASATSIAQVIGAMMDPDKGALAEILSTLEKSKTTVEKLNTSVPELDQDTVDAVLDRIKTLTALIDTMVEYKAPNPLKLYAKLYALDLDIIILGDGLTMVLRSLDALTNILKSPYLSRSRVDAVDAILKSADAIMQTLLNFPIAPRKLLKAKLKYINKDLEEVVLGLIDITDTLETLNDLKLNSKQVAEAAAVLQASDELLKIYIKLSASALVIAPVVGTTAKTLIAVVRSVVLVIAALDKLDVKSSKEKIDALKYIVKSITVTCGLLVVTAAAALAASAVVSALNKFPKIVDAVIKSVDAVAAVKDTKNARQKMEDLQKIVKSIAIICISLVLLTPILYAFALVSPAIIVGLLIFALVCKTLVRVVDFILSCKLALVLMQVAVVLLAMTAIALIVIALALVSEKAIKGFPVVGLMLLGVIGLLGALTLIGWITSTFSAFILAGIIGIGVVTIAVVALTLMVAALWALQEIKLDPDKIKTNVGIVLSTAGFIISSLFESDVDEPGNKKSGFLGMLAAVGGAALKIVEALAASVILVATFVSVGAILLMAGALRLLQEIKLDSAAIHSNVKTVLDETKYITDALFAGDDKKSESSNKGILLSIVDWVSPQLGQVLKAALGMAFLFLSMISIGMVLAIAGMLRLLQEISLDSNKIDENLNLVFGKTAQIIDRIYSPVDDSSKGSSHGLLTTIVGWIDKGLANIISAALGVVYLFLSMISIGMVLAIAGMLRLLQMINLDSGKIDENVTKIFDTVDLITSRVFAPVEESQKRSRGWLGTLISFFSPGLANIIDAIMMIANLSMIFMSISVIVGIAKQLETISKIDFSASDVNSKVDIIFNSAQHVMDAVMNDNIKIPEKKGKSTWSKLAQFFNPVPDEIQDAMTALQSMEVVVSAVGCVGDIAQNMQKMYDATKDINLSAASAMTDRVLEIAEQIADQVFGKESHFKFLEPSPEDSKVANPLIDFFFGAVIKKQKESEALKAALKRVQTLSLIASATGSLASMVDSIQAVSEFQAPTDVQTKVKSIMDTSMDTAQYIFAGKYGKWQVSGTGKLGGEERIASIVKYIETSISGVKKIADAMSQLKDAKVVNMGPLMDGIELYNKQVEKLIAESTYSDFQISAAQTRTINGISALGKVIAQMDSIHLSDSGEGVRSNCDLMDTISSTVGGFVKVDSDDVRNAEAITENYIKFFKQVDNMDIRKLQHTDYIMRSWAAISRELQGNFEGLAQTITDHVMPMLETMNKTLDETTTCQKAIIDELSQPVDLSGGSSSGSSYSPSVSSSPSTGGSSGGSATDMLATPSSTGTSAPRTSATNAGGAGTAQHGQTQRPVRASASKEPDIQPGKYYRVSFAEIKDA